MFTDPVVLNPVQEPKYFKSVKIAQGARQEIVFQLTDSQGRPLSLQDDSSVKTDQFQGDGNGPDALNPGFGDGIVPKGPWPDASVWLVVAPGFGYPECFRVQGVVTDFANGIVTFHVQAEHAELPGIFLGEIGLFRGTRLMTRWPLYYSVEQSLFAMCQPRPRAGIITIPEIRMGLRDLDPSYNDLLDALEFKDAEIAHCIRTPVDLWNETSPLDPALVVQYSTFPFRTNWMRATTGYLLEIAAHWYRRNDLPISAGGITVQDRNKHLTYEPKSEKLIAEYMAWMKQTKAGLSMRLASGCVGSPWPSSTRYA